MHNLVEALDRVHVAFYESYKAIRVRRQNLEMQMPLGKHTRTEKGTFRRERADSLAKNLREEYPEFNKVHGNTKLGTLKKEFEVDSLNAVRRELRKKNVMRNLLAPLAWSFAQI